MKIAYMVGGVVTALVCHVGALALDKSCGEDLLHAGSNSENPLLLNSKHPFEAIPFDTVAFEHLKPALEDGLEKTMRRADEICHNPDPATFENTVLALAEVSEPLEMAHTLLEHWANVNTSPELEEVEREFNQRYSEFATQLSLDPNLLSRLTELHQKKETLGLDPEQLRLLDQTYRSYLRRGAHLDDAAKARLVKINARLSVLSTDFRVNVVNATKEYQLFVAQESDLTGLPERVKADAKEKAIAQGKPDQWLFTLDAPSYLPFLDYAENRALREKIWRAKTQVATSGAYDNRPLLLEVVKLRQERAKIVGYSNYAAYQVEDRMAKTPERIETFLRRLGDSYRNAAKIELEELTAFAGQEIKPWDLSFYSEKLKEQKFSFNEEELRPYFELNNVLKGAFYAAERLYGIQFRKRTDIPTWDPDVQTFEVVDSRGEHLALFYLDPHPRPGRKRPGAYMNDLKGGGLSKGVYRRPHVINVANLARGANGQPSLLGLDEVRTIFHELGHGLHSMLSRVRLRALFGTNVAWDFVELPSQFFENFALQPEVLDVYAHHYETGKRVPAELIERVKAAKNFQIGMLGLGQIRYSMLDLAWHTVGAESVHTVEQVREFENQTIEPYRLLPDSGGLISTAFAHIFSGGYAAGYYSYRWASVLEVDAFSVFEAEGIFNPATAQRFLQNILERGDVEDAEVLYRRFRGGDPDPDALLRSEGLIP